MIMDLKYEFQKIRDAFGRVKTEMNDLYEKINDNEHRFLEKYSILSHKVEEISIKLLHNVQSLQKDGDFEKLESYTKSEIREIKSEIKALKDEIDKTSRINVNIDKSLDQIKKNKLELKTAKEKTKADLKDLKDKNNTEIKELKLQNKNIESEIRILQKQLLQKDLEIQSIKEISRKLIMTIEELSSLELQFVKK